MLRDIFVSAIFGTLLASQALALTVEETGLSVEPPAPFVTEFNTVPETTADIVIFFDPDDPGNAEHEAFQCLLGYREEPANAGLTQEEINAYVASPANIADTSADLASSFNFMEPTLFSVAGVTGIEFLGITLEAPSPIYLISLQTPNGITTMTCYESREQFPQTIRLFRSIRDTITPP